MIISRIISTLMFLTILDKIRFHNQYNFAINKSHVTKCIIYYKYGFIYLLDISEAIE